MFKTPYEAFVRKWCAVPHFSLELCESAFHVARRDAISFGGACHKIWFTYNASINQFHDRSLFLALGLVYTLDCERRTMRAVLRDHRATPTNPTKVNGHRNKYSDQTDYICTNDHMIANRLCVCLV